MSTATPRFQRLRGIGLWFARNDQLVLSVLAAIIGAAVAYGVIGFLALITLLQELTFANDLTFGSTLERVFSFALDLPWWHIILVPTAGGFLIGLFLKFAMPGGQAQGVAQVIEAGALRGGHIGLDRGLGAAVVSAATLGFGGSAGREGPMIHLGGAMASFTTRHLHLNPQLSQTLLGCGVAAGIAASFNAPIAGVIFALEVVIRHYALSAFSPIVIAAVAGTVISRFHLGDFPAFIVPPFTVGSFWEFPAYVLLGFLASGIAILFMTSLMQAQEAAKRIPAPPWLHPTFGGLIVGLIAVFYPQILGVGYETTDALLQGNIPLTLIIALVAAKLLATTATLGLGFGGGVFSPSLFLGAALGAAFGMIAAIPFPDLASSPTLYAIIGMGAVAAPVLGAPISTILILFELTGDFTVTAAAMTAVVIASITTRQLIGKSYFELQLERAGISLSGGPARALLRQQRVRDVARHGFHSVNGDTSIDALRSLMKLEPGRTFFVTDEGTLVGVIATSDLVQAALDPDKSANLTARDIAGLNPIFLVCNDNLEHALAVLAQVPEDDVPVVRDAQSLEVVGLVRHHDVLSVFNQALLKVQAEEHDERP